MPMLIRIIQVALAVAALAMFLAIPRAHAQGNVQKCEPSNTTHTQIVKLPGVKVFEQTCVIRFRSAGKVKAWVHTTWTRTSNRTRFRTYTVQARLEFHDLDVETLRCRYAKVINSTRSGSRTCETTARVAISQSKLYTGDGAVDYNAGNGHRHRGLQGSRGV
jgi:hypothetical protein